MKVTELVCANCSIKFTRDSNRVKKGAKIVYCSRSCASANGPKEGIPLNSRNNSVPVYPLSDKWPLDIQKRVHNRKKIWCIDYKGGKCEVCNYSRHPSALEFHHKNPLLKKFEIGDSKNTISKKVLQKELDKCALLCANCHREVHAGLVVVESD